MSSLDTELARLNEVVGAVNVPFSTKSVSDAGTLVLRGIAAGPQTDLEQESFDPKTLRAAFEKYVQTSPTVVLEHDQTLVLGRITEAVYSPAGDIEVEAHIPKPASFAPVILQKAYAAILAGGLKSFSVGGRWRPLRLASGIVKLFTTQVAEVSVAVQGVNPSATFELAGVKALTGSNLDGELERLAALGSGALDRELAKLAAL